MENEEKKVLTKEQRESKVYNIALQIEQVTAQKKAISKSYTEQLKELKSEMKDVLTQAGEDLN